MKIVFLSRYQNTVERGAEVFVSELTKKLSKKHNVDIFFDKKADSIKDVLAGKYDVVIPVNGRLQSLRASLARLIRGYKVLITGQSGKGCDDIWNIAVCKPDVFIALTDYAANWAKRWAWGSKVVKIPNGIDCDSFSLKGEKIAIDLPRPIILSVGALIWYKHHERAIEAVARLKDGSLLIVGEGEDKKKLEEQGKKLLGGRFKIMSFPYHQMTKVYRSVDLFTLPSWNREAFGIVYLEALASGLGIVAPNDLSRQEIIGEAGILVDTEDSAAYVNAIENALNIDWKKRSREQAEKFSWEKVAIQYEQLLKSL